MTETSLCGQIRSDSLTRLRIGDSRQFATGNDELYETAVAVRSKRYSTRGLLANRLWQTGAFLAKRMTLTSAIEQTAKIRRYGAY